MGLLARFRRAPAAPPAPRAPLVFRTKPSVPSPHWKHINTDEMPDPTERSLYELVLNRAIASGGAVLVEHAEDGTVTVNDQSFPSLEAATAAAKEQS